MTRLRTVSCQDTGWRRVRRGRGFRYLDHQGASLDAPDISRIKSLAIPPAWSDVWICPIANGHLQAVGTDAAGRRQYLYHPDWRQQRDEAKFERVLAMAAQLPTVRRTVRGQLRGEPTDRRTVVAAAIRLVDLGCFRLGSEEYADENGSYGLTTLERRHVRRAGPDRVFAFVGKGGIENEVVVADAAVARVVDALTARRRQGARLLAAREAGRWRPVEAAEINARLHELFGLEVTAKDFRTWHATVTVAAALGSVERAATTAGRRRQVRQAISEAADLLGNTPAVARSSYVDPRVIDRFEDGQTMTPGRSQDALDRAVVELLTD